MPLTEATLRNLRRKSQYVDHVQWRHGVPLWSWLDLSLTELCNRSKGHAHACVFCPRIDPMLYPNQNLHMDLRLARKIALELDALQYEGTVVLCGYGEPLLHPRIEEIVELFRCRVEVVTNGDFLSVDKIKRLRFSGMDYFVVSLYDGPHQVEIMHKRFADAGLNEHHYLLRDRWHTAEDQFGLKLTNRGGTVDVGPQDPVDTHRPCHYLTYQMSVDWNGDVVLCPQDWQKKLKFGNLNTDTMFQVWTSKRMNKRRQVLMKGLRVEHPCKDCNTDGTLHGFNHAPAWTKKEETECSPEEEPKLSNAS